MAGPAATAAGTHAGSAPETENRVMKRTHNLRNSSDESDPAWVLAQPPQAVVGSAPVPLPFVGDGVGNGK